MRQLLSRRHDDTGSSLILAMVFLVVGSLVVLSLANAATNDLHNAAAFAGVRTTHAAETSTADLALYDVRYTPATCTPNTPVNYVNAGVTYSAWCSTVSTPTSATSRVVTLSVCVASVASNACSLNPLLSVSATFDDYAPGLHPPVRTECSSNCGASMSVTDWKFR